MPTSVKQLENMAPNSVEKREETRKQGRCQKCLAKVPLASQFAVLNDLDNGKVKVAKATAHEDKSHYCGDCKDVRVKMKENWLNTQRDAQSGGGSKKKPAAKTKKAPAKKKAAAKKRPPAKKGKAAPKKKAAAKSGDEPF